MDMIIFDVHIQYLYPHPLAEHPDYLFEKISHGMEMVKRNPWVMVRGNPSYPVSRIPF